ncbi:MAG: hypothetical protein ABJC33_06410 [Betaproteobacteria bacterium]
MQDNNNSSSGSTKKVGIYDRPPSADRPKTRTLAIAVIVLVLVVAVIYFLRAR